MADVFSKEKRSWVMSRIRSRNTKLETAFCKYVSKTLYSQGYRYRRNHKGLPGKPDLVFHKQRVAVFIDGDFWHGYNMVKLGKKPVNAYWLEKITNNMARDKRNTRDLKKAGWRVLRFWEHDVEKKPEKVLQKITRVLNEY